MQDFDDPLNKFMLHTVMWEMGILPLDFDDCDVGRRLAQLAPDEARRLKRRFRKVWRSLKPGPSKIFSPRMGEPHPSRKTKKARKYIVLYECLQRARMRKEKLACKTERD